MTKLQTAGKLLTNGTVVLIAEISDDANGTL